MDREEGNGWKRKCMAMGFSKVIFESLCVDKESHHRHLIVMLKNSGNIYLPTYQDCY